MKFMKMKALASTLLFLIVLSCNQIFAQAGFLDSTFNSNGKVITPIGIIMTWRSQSRSKLMERLLLWEYKKRRL
jgi:hypothetical protein